MVLTMSARIQEYVKYTQKELEDYTKDEGSCVEKVSTKLHLGLPPHALKDFRKSLLDYISQKKIGSYDSALEAIILDIRNIKVLNGTGRLRGNDPTLHVDIQADCYIFRPQIGAVIKGVVKHISGHNIGILSYRVFSVSIRLQNKRSLAKIQMNAEIQFRIKNFDLRTSMPFIEGELVSSFEGSNQDGEVIILDDNNEDNVELKTEIKMDNDTEIDGDDVSDEKPLINGHESAKDPSSSQEETSSRRKSPRTKSKKRKPEDDDADTSLETTKPPTKRKKKIKTEQEHVTRSRIKSES